MDKAEAEAVLTAAQRRSRAQVAANRRYRQRRKERELAALRAVGHTDRCTVRRCVPDCLVSRYGPPPSGLDPGYSDPSDAEHIEPTKSS